MNFKTVLALAALATPLQVFADATFSTGAASSPVPSSSTMSETSSATTNVTSSLTASASTGISASTDMFSSSASTTNTMVSFNSATATISLSTATSAIGTLAVGTSVATLASSTFSSPITISIKTIPAPTTIMGQPVPPVVPLNDPLGPNNCGENGGPGGPYGQQVNAGDGSLKGEKGGVAGGQQVDRYQVNAGQVGSSCDQGGISFKGDGNGNAHVDVEGGSNAGDVGGAGSKNLYQSGTDAVVAGSAALAVGLFAL
ncbi:hypothetical protein BC830DRAFT_1167782 [Chytriomyces sp. MP71]|nr:hypothetical protein BC830DRAFT_1167782 [Chytriomyces sp. MP71]